VALLFGPIATGGYQSIHANRAVTGLIDWPQILLLYQGLVQLTGGIGSHIGRAVAMAEAGQPNAGLAALALPNE
jgi:RNA polymerase sigma-70 factor, ECF subfamily